ncbi:uncharacterized protein TNCV_1553481 [Trichonephila clavipes]|nr:uncharacterized protein TNCV_1553481 [Trichonephila clavipes]
MKSEASERFLQLRKQIGHKNSCQVSRENAPRFPTATVAIGETSGSERCHLHEDQAQDALDRPVSRRPPHRKKCTRTANCFIGRHPGTGSTFTREPLCLFESYEGDWLKDIWDSGAHYVSCP